MTASLYQSGSPPRSLNRVFLLLILLLFVVCAKAASAIQQNSTKEPPLSNGEKLYSIENSFERAVAADVRRRAGLGLSASLCRRLRAKAAPPPSHRFVSAQAETAP